MKQTLLYLTFLLFAFACKKDDTTDGGGCTTDGLARVEIFNNHGFDVEVRVIPTLPDGSAGQMSQYDLAAGGTWVKNLPVGQYSFHVIGDDGNEPYASESVNFGVNRLLDDCETLRLEP